MSALFGFCAWWQGPGLWRDWQISQNPQHLPNGQVLDGECSTRRGLTDCEAHLVYDYNGQAYEADVSLAFVDFSSGDYEVEVVVSRDKPELATISLGLDMLWNRLIVFALLMLLFGGGTIGMIVAGLKAMAANRAVATPGRLTVVPVEVIEQRNGYVSYVDHNKGPKSRRTTRTRLGRGQEPLMAVSSDGRTVGVAVVSEHCNVPVLLDRALERIDLTERERDAVYATLDAQQRAPEVVESKGKGGPNIWRGVLGGLGVLLLMLIGAVGYWLYYVTSGPDAFDSVGMEINNIMPEAINLWGCTQLEARFGDSNAPYGCTASDYMSWKTVQPSKIKS
ncbi:hypothetical protein [Devosia sp. SL43]|uniref:hypothetical protein n=1 Tax=Devosia sp. SL43 TaxID=2806348 RepID=UPI001F3133E3|nr:hypothetical protein [Devosia sp. SL43]UJW87179.1 hypothetical protein IM737_08040 [Devosia sp. SL43]